MRPLFGEPDSFLGGDDEVLPLVVGTVPTLPFGGTGPSVVAFCVICEQRYSLPDEIDDVRLLEMCPRCAHLSGGVVELLESPILPDR